MSSPSDMIKAEALRLGFEACGICKAEYVEEHSKHLGHWLESGFNGTMSYMNNHMEKRSDPRLLVKNAKSVIVVALNYFPEKKQSPEAPLFSYYAYGKDYHPVVKERLGTLYEYINREIFPVNGRFFCDSAPFLEKYHAQKAGIGWIGKNTQLIIPGKGSFFFLGEIIIDKELDYDQPWGEQCGNCRKCMESCPTQAIVNPGQLNASRCLSYLTIEYKGNLPHALPENIVYGCDICNKACPHNRFAQPTQIMEFYPSSDFLGLSKKDILDMDEETFNRIFQDSPVKRIGLERLKRNLNQVI